MTSVCVIDIRSLSYTGTTWINLLVGSHPTVFALGPPQRVYRALDGSIAASQLCRNHAEDCTFWPSALAELSEHSSIHAGLASLTGCTHVALNNPFVDPRGLTDLEAPGVKVIGLSVVRDVRAVVASHRRRHDTSVRESAEWVRAHAGLADAASSPGLRLQHEAVVADPHRALAQVAEVTGIAWGPDAHRFWEFEHHPVGGNGGPINVLRAGRAPDRATQADWSTELTPDDLATIRSIAGSVHEAWGYTW